MKFNIELAELNRTIGRVIGVVEKRTTIPILSNIKIESQGNGLRFTATDLEIDFTDIATAEIIVPGVTTIPATVYDISKKWQAAQVGGTVSFDIEDGTAKIKCGRSRFSVPVLSAEDFPETSVIEGQHTFEVSGSEFADLFISTAFCMSDDKARHYLDGVHIHGGSELNAVATDGNKLAHAKLEGVNHFDFPGVIVPRKAVQEIIKLCDGATSVKVWINDRKICVATGNSTIVSKLIDGTFPDYQRVIPQSKSATVEVDGKVFAQAVDRAALVCSEKTKGVKVEFDNDHALISAGRGGGTAEETVDIKMDGPAMAVGFNSRYLCDVAAACGKAALSIDLVDAFNPAVFRPANDTSKMYLVMPMRC